MKRKFINTDEFDKCWDKSSLNDDDLKELQSFLMKNPFAGDLIEGTGGLRKLRWALPHTGKSGGIRLLYIDFTKQEITMLVTCYGKNIKETISDNEKAMYKEFIKRIGKEL